MSSVVKKSWAGTVPSADALSALDGHVQGVLGAAIIDTCIANDELTITVAAADILSVLTALRDDPHTSFNSLMDVAGADYPDRAERFEVVYHLLSYARNIRLRLRVVVGEDIAVPSATSVFVSADWFEREIWDMFGIPFIGHPDMRRLLTDYGFTGFPLRKDFPLSGFVEVRYSEEDKRVIYEPVKLTQDFRNFDFLSPWEGAHYALPGDEKAEPKK